MSRSVELALTTWHALSLRSCKRLSNPRRNAWWNEKITNDWLQIYEIARVTTIYMLLGYSRYQHQSAIFIKKNIIQDFGESQMQAHFWKMVGEYFIGWIVADFNGCTLSKNPLLHHIPIETAPPPAGISRWRRDGRGPRERDWSPCPVAARRRCGDVCVAYSRLHKSHKFMALLSRHKLLHVLLNNRTSSR